MESRWVPDPVNFFKKIWFSVLFWCLELDSWRDWERQEEGSCKWDKSKPQGIQPHGRTYFYYLRGILYPDASSLAVLYFQSGAVSACILKLLPKWELRKVWCMCIGSRFTWATLCAGLCNLVELLQKEDLKLNKNLVPNLWLSWWFHW